MAHSLVKIGKPRRTRPSRWRSLAGAGGGKKAGVWPGPEPGPRSDYGCLCVVSRLSVARRLAVFGKEVISSVRVRQLLDGELGQEEAGE